MDQPAALSSLAGLGAFGAGHAALHRLRPSNNPRILAALLLGAAGLALGEALLYAGRGWDVVGGCAVCWFYFAGFILYLFVYAGLARSVSVTLLARLAHGRGATLDELTADYGGSSRFEDRLELMSREGLIRLSGAQAALTAKGRALAGTARVLGRLLGGGMEG